MIDADLQDPPELIPRLVATWRERGADVVYAQRIARAGEGPLKRGTAHLFYVLMQHVGRIHIPPDTGDFRLLSRRAVEALREYPEHHRFMKGLFTWIGFEQVAVTYERDPRQAGSSKWSWLKLINLAIEGITSFTAAPLRFASVLGLIIASVAFVDALYIIYKTVRYGEPVAGYPSLMTAVLFLGGVQLTAIGILGEYLGRVFNETKRRPLYHVKDYRPATAASAPAAGRARRCGVSACSAARASARLWRSACSMAGSRWSGWAPRSSTCWPTPADRAVGAGSSRRQCHRLRARRQCLVPRPSQLDLPRRASRRCGRQPRAVLGGGADRASRSTACSSIWSPELSGSPTAGPSR